MLVRFDLYLVRFAMHDVKMIRMFRENIVKARNPQNIRELCDLLGALLRENEAEIALRLKLVKKKCKLLLDRSGKSLSC